MAKFFIHTEQIKDNKIIIKGQDVNHIANVLRIKEKENITVCNMETGENYCAKILEETQSEIICEILENLKAESEANIYINIFQGLPKADKMELIIQKCTELGVKEITPVNMNRSIVKLDAKTESKKIRQMANNCRSGFKAMWKRFYYKNK